MTIVLATARIFFGLSEWLGGFARVRKEDGMIHGAEPGQIFFASPDSDQAQLDVRCFPE